MRTSSEEAMKYGSKFGDSSFSLCSSILHDLESMLPDQPDTGIDIHLFESCLLLGEGV